MGHHPLNVSIKHLIEKHVFWPTSRLEILGYCHCSYSNEKSEVRITGASTIENDTSSSQPDKAS